MLINVKMPTIVAIFNIYEHDIINTTYESLKARKVFIFSVLIFKQQSVMSIMSLA